MYFSELVPAARDAIRVSEDFARGYTSEQSWLIVVFAVSLLVKVFLAVYELSHTQTALFLLLLNFECSNKLLIQFAGSVMNR